MGELERQYPSQLAESFDKAPLGEKPKIFYCLVEERAKKIGVSTETLLALLGHSEYGLRSFADPNNPDREMSSPLMIETMFQKAEQEMLSFIDRLTKVWNRRYLEYIFPILQTSACGDGVAHEQRRKKLDMSTEQIKPPTFSCIMIDIDNFKKFNDIFGHSAGDKVLMKVAQIINTAVRKDDIVGRYGGEEFVVYAMDANGEAGELAERIRSLVEHGAISFKDNEGNELKVTISLGVSSFVPQPEGTEYGSIDKSTMHQHADAALYAAKKHGKNRVWYHDLDKKEAEPYLHHKGRHISKPYK
ncbi:MAG: GGDEF domain-containing protein [Patescibacteria group bacterium]